MKEKLPIWDLSDFYKSVDDPKIRSDVRKNLAEAGQFNKKYKGRVDKLDSKQLEAAFRELEIIALLYNKLFGFANITHTTDSLSQKNGVLRQQMLDHVLTVQGFLIFFELEIMELPKERLAKLINERILRNYKHYLQNLVKFKPHHLTETEERIFNDKMATSGVAFVRLFDEHFAAKQFDVKLGKIVKTMTQTEILHLAFSSQRDTRKAAAEGFTKGLAKDKQLLTLIYNTIVKDTAIFGRWHKYKNPEDFRHLSNELDSKTVDTMISVFRITIKSSKISIISKRKF